MATEADKLNTGAIATLVAVLALTMVAIVAVLTAMVRGEVDEEVARKGGTASSREYRDLAAEQNTILTQEARWANPDAGVLSIPIDRSMNLVVDDIRRDPTLATAPPADAGVAQEANTANDADTASEEMNPNVEPQRDAAEPRTPAPHRPTPSSQPARTAPPAVAPAPTTAIQPTPAPTPLTAPSPQPAPVAPPDEPH